MVLDVAVTIWLSTDVEPSQLAVSPQNKQKTVLLPLIAILPHPMHPLIILILPPIKLTSIVWPGWSLQIWSWGLQKHIRIYTYICVCGGKTRYVPEFCSRHAHSWSAIVQSFIVSTLCTFRSKPFGCMFKMLLLHIPSQWSDLDEIQLLFQRSLCIMYTEINTMKECGVEVIYLLFVSAILSCYWHKLLIKLL